MATAGTFVTLEEAFFVVLAPVCSGDCEALLAAFAPVSGMSNDEDARSSGADEAAIRREVRRARSGFCEWITITSREDSTTKRVARFFSSLWNRRIMAFARTWANLV